MKIQVIIVAGGIGKRFGSKRPKSLVLLKSKAVIAYSLAVFEKCKAVDGVVIVGHKDYLTDFQRVSGAYHKTRIIVPGGATRSDSVKCGLAAVDADTDIVLVHDAARPLIDVKMVERILTALRKDKAAIVAVPVKATIKSVDTKSHYVQGTLKRDLLWDVQTPQGFRKETLMRAHTRAFRGEATDDAMLVENLGIKVKVVMGDYRNMKITTPEDLDIAKGLL